MSDTSKLYEIYVKSVKQEDDWAVNLLHSRYRTITEAALKSLIS